jgi:short subunit dehydrogenase-like uncharacterized protein
VANMRERVVRLESAEYEIVECEHELEALTRAFSGAKVVCSTVGPFVNFGLVGVEAALRAGCHYLDTTGEQSYIIEARDTFGAEYAKANLVCAPSTSYMYALAEIACEIALERPGIDMLETVSISRVPREAGGVTVGSTASIFELFRNPAYHLWDNEMVAHDPGASVEISVPEFMRPAFALPWGGTSLPAFYQHDPRVRYCDSYVSFYDNQVMRMVAGLGQKWEAEYKDLPAEQQEAVIAQLVDSTTPSMPPRERTTRQRSTDIAVGRGALSSVRVAVNSVTPYITTGALQTAAVEKLLADDFAKAGVRAGCTALGHRVVRGVLAQRGLAAAAV